MYSCYEHSAKIVWKSITASLPHSYPSHTIILYFAALNSVRLSFCSELSSGIYCSFCLPFLSSLLFLWTGLLYAVAHIDVSRVLPLWYFWCSGVRITGPDSRLLPPAALPRSVVAAGALCEYLLALSAASVQARLVSNEPAAAYCKAQALLPAVIVSQK
jgi:hypothetical protein